MSPDYGHRATFSEMQITMYLIEPLLNKFYRQTMRSVLRFGSVEEHPVPPRSAADTNDYLLYVHIPFCETLCPYCSFHRYALRGACPAVFRRADHRACHV